MSRQRRTGIGSGLTLLLALVPIMLDQYYVQSPFFGSLAFVGMIAVGIYTVWNLPFRKSTRWICAICFLIGAGGLGWWLNNHRRVQQSEGQENRSTVGNQNSVARTTGDYSPAITGNNNKVTYGKTAAQEQQEREERQRAIVEHIKMIRAHIFLAEKNGGEWQGTNDEGIQFLRQEGQRDVLRKSYNPNLPDNPHVWPRFTPEVCHTVGGLVIPQATIYLTIPRNITVEFLPSHVEPPDVQRWTPVGGNSYYTMVGQATESLCSGVLQSIALKFPGPNTYPIEYILSLPINGLGDIRGTVYFEVTD